jgi:mono/diheme cytochrome c family protein
MKLEKRRLNGLFLGLFAALLLFGVSCQEQTDPDIENEGVLNDVPSIAETLGTTIPTAPPLPTADPEELALGQQIYSMHCAACHGVNLEGQENWQIQNEDGSFRPPPHNEEGHTWHHSDRILIEAIVEGGARLPDNIGGTSNMPAFGEILTDEEIIAVLAYIKSSWPDDIRQAQWEQSATDPRR